MRKMARQGYIRPLLLMVIGWFMGTRQMIRKHTDSAHASLILLLPAYYFFYTMYAAAAFVLVYQEFDRREGPAEGAIKCTDYFYDVYDKFGYIADSYEHGSDREVFRFNNFLFRMLAIAAAQLVAGFVVAWAHRPSTGRVTTLKELRELALLYSVGSLALGVAVFVAVTLVLPRDEGDPHAAGRSPCFADSLDIMS